MCFHSSLVAVSRAQHQTSSLFSSLAVNMAAQNRSVLLAAVAGVLLASFVLLALTEPADAAADQLPVSGEWQSSN
jgi:hypothetical protein